MTDQEREIQRVISYIRSCRDAGIDTTITIDKTRNHFILNALEEIQQYRVIGTVEECREAMERQRSKKPKKILDETNRFYRYYCPVCGRYFGNDKTRNGTFLFKEIYCQEENCGQAISWERDNE